MNRRDFFGWVAKAAATVGLSRLAFDTEPADAAAMPMARPVGARHAPLRMNGRACRDFRMLSDDRSILLDKEIFNA